MIDEIDTHQRATQQRFRSQKPVGVIQEFYGLVLAQYAIRAVMYDAGTHSKLSQGLPMIDIYPSLAATQIEFSLETPHFSTNVR